MPFVHLHLGGRVRGTERWHCQSAPHDGRIVGTGLGVLQVGWSRVAVVAVARRQKKIYNTFTTPQTHIPQTQQLNTAHVSKQNKTIQNTANKYDRNTWAIQKGRAKVNGMPTRWLQNGDRNNSVGPGRSRRRFSNGYARFRPRRLDVGLTDGVEIGLSFWRAAEPLRSSCFRKIMRSSWIFDACRQYCGPRVFIFFWCVDRFVLLC